MIYKYGKEVCLFCLYGIGDGSLLFGYDWVVIGGAKPFYESFFGIASDPVMQGIAMTIIGGIGIAMATCTFALWIGCCTLTFLFPPMNATLGTYKSRPYNLMLHRILFLFIIVLVPFVAHAQRRTDPLDRGVVAVKVTSGVFVSWRVQADEYYGVKYNLYRNGSLVAENLSVSNYSDWSGSVGSTYAVAPVRNGVVGDKSVAVSTWETQYFDIPVSDVQNTLGETIWKQSDTSTALANYTINDISLGDIDGDGKIDFIVKRKNQTDQDECFPTTNTTMFCQIEAYGSSINYGRLWWIDCGPNICYGADEQWDAVCFDWNEDGACEVLYRGGANTVLHHSDGKTQTIGNTNENIRGGITHAANYTFSNAGEEWLMYIDGKTGKAFDAITYPLPRGNASDWGDSYGHRSSKYFMGAPYLDGTNPFIFLGRGIYTKIDACTYRVNKSTNKLYKVGNTWHSYTNSGWYAQGYHNFAIADVDEDGRDEVVYGSMVLDFHTSDNSLHGMSSTGLGHGDASHTGDLDPYRKGLETFACNEEKPAFNFRNAATCEIYARGTSDSDDGRSMACNASNEYPGCIGASTASGIIPLSMVQADPYAPIAIEGMTNNWNAQTPYPMALNFRIYWDGDLLDETINGPGSNESYLYVDKLGSRIFATNSPQWSTSCINGTKKNPCAVGDILGDWREEMVMRTSDNRFIRIYTTADPTTHRMPSLWYDHQYRQAMVWQTEGYNQPAHTSFFVGELEGLTQAPPALTLTSRTSLSNGASITSVHNGKDVYIGTSGEGAASSVSLASGAQPYTLYLYSPVTIEGGDQVVYKETKHTYDRIRLTGDALSGVTNVCKQGWSAAHLPNKQHTHTGKTDIWQGALVTGGSMVSSPLWANLHTELFLGTALSSASAVFRSIEMEYGSSLFLSDPNIDIPIPGNNGYAHLSIVDLELKEGARVVFDLNGTGNASGDRLDITGTLSVTQRNWQYGPKYAAPVFELRSSSKLAEGEYELGTFNTMGFGNLGQIVIELPGGTDCPVAQIYAKAGKYYLHLGTSMVDDESVQNDLAVTNDYYLQNVATGLFLQGGASWGTRAIVGEGGINFTLTEMVDGKYSLNSHISNGAGLNFLSAADEPYVDATETGFVLRKQVNGAYAINNGSAYLSASDGAAEVNFNGSDATSAYAQWRFLTLDEIKEQISKAVPVHPQVATTLLLDPNFGRNDQRYSAWTWSSDCTNKSNSDNSSEPTNWCVESWHSTFTFSQQLTDIPNGTYLLYGQGFYRQDGTDNNHLPVLFANSAVSTLPILAGTENNMGDAGRSFADGKYEIDPVVVTVTDGTLTVGVKNTENKNLWAIWDNLRLYYLGEVKTGDVNGDGKVTLSDLPTLVDILNGKCQSPVPVIKTSDLNKDSKVDKSDVDKMVEILSED